MDPALEPVSPQGTPVRGSAAPREVWERQYRSGGWDYLGGPDDAARYLAIAHLCARHLGGARLLDIGCGTGILLACLQRHAGVAPSRYSGVDLAEAALRQASSIWPGAAFSRLDYAADPVAGRYDGVIFNETLYCFDDPVAILQKCMAENMHAGSLLIVSMYGEHHEPIWDAIAAHCATLEQQVVGNGRGVHWKIRALRPIARASA